jgi:hypothetical protein
VRTMIASHVGGPADDRAVPSKSRTSMLCLAPIAWSKRSVADVVKQNCRVCPEARDKQAH